MHFNNKKQGFTLAEIVIALCIVALISALSVPILKQQLSKIDEYAYYMAFKTVEKMGAQIAMLGDPDEPPLTTNNNINGLFTYEYRKTLIAFAKGVAQRFANSEQSVFHKLFPLAIAGGNSDNVPTSNTPTDYSSYCDASHGYYNHTNEISDGVSCVCKINYVKSSNNPNVCCPTQDGAQSYAFPDTSLSEDNDNYYSCVACSTDFNPDTGECCMSNSTYNASEGGCVCLSGYTEESGACVATSCPSGYQMDTSTKTCIKNPPIMTAKRFCELIHKNWNVSPEYDDSYCPPQGESYNVNLYNAVLGSGEHSNSAGGVTIDSTQIMYSYDSKSGAFENIDPHVVLANGVKLWILSDKASSIFGLSYSPSIASINFYDNLCVYKNKRTEADCNADGGYFCGSGGDNNCYGFAGTDAITWMGDARNCCSVPDYSDIALAASADPQWSINKDPRILAISGFTVLADINGNRGTSTLWEDVYPFFISSNGRVYPGYPLDTGKALADDSSTYSGGNSDKLLTTDVYYFANNDAGTARKKVVAFAGISYARALCSARVISFNTPYCQNLGGKFNGGSFKKPDGTVAQVGSGIGYLQDDDTVTTGPDGSIGTSKNPCDYYKCFMSPRKKVRLF